MIIIVSKSGQLGNRLFQFAHFVAFSEQCGVTIWNPGFDEYADSFAGTRQSAVCRYPLAKGPGLAASVRPSVYQAAYKVALFAKNRNLQPLRLRSIFLDWDEEYRLDNPAFEASLRKRQILLLHGYEFRARSYFARHADAIRSYFAPTGDHQRQIEASLAKTRANADIVVGIHIRRGDYKDFLGGRYFYEIASYLEMMKAIEQLFPGKRVGFLVCSNQHWDAGLFSSFNTTFGPGHQVEDLYSLAHCDYLAGPPSSYTLWASFYGQRPLYFKRDQGAVPAKLEDFRIYSEEERLVF